MNPRRHGTGFTLIEMLVVLIIISVLLTLLISSAHKIEAGQRKGETISRLKALHRALAVYREDWGDVPPYNPDRLDLDGDGNPDEAGPGLWALVMLDYLRTYKTLNDPASPIETPWILAQDGTTRIEVVPGDATSMGAAHNEWYDPDVVLGDDLTQHQEWLVYCLLATPEWHDIPPSAPTTPSNYGAFDDYDAVAYENYCSWMMRDPYSDEWKYRPVRKIQAAIPDPDPSSGGFPVNDDVNWPELYHRQLSHHWTDEPTPYYLPAGDTVITWSNLYREIEQRPTAAGGLWGHDLILYSDGHVAVVPGPVVDVGSDWQQARAVTRPPAP